MADQLTLKQRKWIDIYIETGNATEAAMQVYDCKDRDSAKVIGSENISKLNYTDFLEAAGVTDKLLQEKIMEGLDATRTVSAVNTKKNATAESTDFIDVPDFMARHKYLETTLKLKKRLNDKLEITGKDGEPLKMVFIKYGDNDPVSIPAARSHVEGTARPAPLPSAELAPQSSEDDSSSQPTDPPRI